MSVYTRRLCLVRSSSDGVVETLFQAAGGTATVLRDILWVDESSARVPVNVELIVQPEDAGSNTLLRVDALTARSYHLELRQVLEPGEFLQALVSGSSLWSIAVTGYVFTT